MSNQLQELEDLKVFHDPFSEANFIPKEDGGWVAEFERRGKKISLRRDAQGKIFLASTGELVAGNFMSLLAGKYFSNIKYLAKALLHEYCAATENIMKVPFSIDDGMNEKSTFQQIDSFLSNLAVGGVVGLEGPAGAGKTHFIERLAASRAQSIVSGSGTAPLVIPVASAGKILSAIDDRIDGSLSALRSSFNRAEISPLMRNGIISLAIDGFDELSDSRGYDNSWSALRELLRDIGGKGLIILSGRDSFISKDVLKELIGTSVSLIGSPLHSINVGFPNSSDAVSWLGEQNSEWLSHSEEVRERFSSYSWLRRPFFVSQIARMEPDAFLNSEDEPIISLCSSMVLREVEKLGMPSELPAENGVAIVYSILTEAARTMLDYELDFVDSSLLEIAVELACAEHAPGDEAFARALSARAKTLTLLEPAPGTGDRDNRRFPHEKIKAFFYSKYLLNEIPSEAPAPLGLRRAQLSISDLSVFGALLRASDTEVSRDLLTSLLMRTKEESSGTTLSGNLVALSIACLPEFNSDDYVEISNCQVLDAVFPDNPAARMKGVYLNRIDARGCNLTHVVFETCEVGEAIVSVDTRFSDTLPKIHALLVENTNGVENRFHDEADIQREIAALQVVKNLESKPRLSNTLEILVRLMLRGHWVRLSRDDKRGRRILDREDWPKVRAVLEGKDLLEIKNLGAGGKPSEFVHLKRADEFLSPGVQADQVRAAIRETGGSL
ncbi:hypothetical protein [Microbaculum marinisediminis]|uniref:NACHT domain-containing protein n=1 Tax=Microbaculum marinisediminis TaxID=2931392 RepID=A0AAW5QRK5_9HYPH|nr:hypothetical protein [Microbaculum sp. A6E488]MCT8970716.1 hypothetical protein [Microbaculum sp. A6E488]